MPGLKIIYVFLASKVVRFWSCFPIEIIELIIYVYFDTLILLFLICSTGLSSIKVKHNAVWQHVSQKLASCFPRQGYDGWKTECSPSLFQPLYILDCLNCKTRVLGNDDVSINLKLFMASDGHMQSNVK